MERSELGVAHDYLCQSASSVFVKDDIHRHCAQRTVSSDVCAPDHFVFPISCTPILLIKIYFGLDTRFRLLLRRENVIGSRGIAVDDPNSGNRSRSA